MDWLPPPPPPLLLAVEASPATLVFQKAKGTLPSGHRRWVLQLRRGGKTLASWPAVSGTRRAQASDRRWSPGSGCICLPNKADTDAVATWINKAGVRRLQVLN